MPFCGHFSHERFLAIVAVCVTVAAFPAAAGGAGEAVYADSFGNLIVHSPAGFKRIVVGRGYLAGKPARGGPKVVYLEEERGRVYLRERKPCHHGALLRGRGYMYGLPDNALPVLSACP